MKRNRKPLVPLVALILLLSLFTGCSAVTVVGETTRAGARTPQTEPETASPTEPATAESSAPETTVPETTAAETTAATTALGFEVPPDLGPYEPDPYVPVYDSAYEAKIDEGRKKYGSTLVVMPSRSGVVYPRRLPAPDDLTHAATRAELVAIVNWHAFYRESGFSVELGYAASDADEELNYLWRNSDLLPSLCSLFGSLENGVLTVDLKFYPESYVASNRYTTPAKIIGVERTPPNGTDTLPGLDPEHGISVWDSDQACYCLANGYPIAPIPGSPADELVEAASQILLGIVDDGMTVWQIAYRVTVWLLEHAAYDQAEHWAGSASLDKTYESEMISARLISFKAEGPLLYGVGVCFGYAKASALLLGLEGINFRRVIAFDTRLVGRSCILPNGSSIAIHSYLYLRIDGCDYIFDPTHAGEMTLSVRDRETGKTEKISVYRDFSIGLSFEEHRKVFRIYAEKDFYASTDEYNPGMYNYLDELTYDGTHDLLLSTRAEAQDYYAYLLDTVFSEPPELRTLTLFYDKVTYADWQTYFRPWLDAFLEKTGVPYKYTEYDYSGRNIATVMVIVAFGK